MELGEAEAVGVLYDDEGGVGHVDADLDHRGRDEHAGAAAREGLHHRILLGRLHATVDEANPLAEAHAQRLSARLGRGEVALLALLDEGADPIGLSPALQMAGERVDDLVEAILGDDARLDRFAAGRHLVEAADVHLAVLRQRQRARDRRRGHREEVRAAALFLEEHALGDAEAMLLVDDDEAEIAVADRFLEDGVGADQDVDRAVGEAHQRRLAPPPLVAPGEDGDVDREAGELALQRLAVLAREDLGRREERALRARLDRDEERHRGDQRLARADVSLEEAEHGGGLGEIALDLRDRPRLRAGEAVGQPQHRAEATVTDERPALPFARRGADQRHRQLVGEDLVIAEPLARLGVGGIGVDAGERVAPVGPAARGLQARLDPFGQLGRAIDRLLRQRRETARGEAFRQRVDRLALAERLPFGQDVGMDDLQVLAILVEPTRDADGGAERQELLHPTRAAAEIGEADIVAERVGRLDAGGAAAGGRAVVARGQRDRDGAADVGLHQLGAGKPVDPAGRQVEGDVDDAFQPEPVERLGERGADALQCGDLGEQRVEDVGAHETRRSCQPARSSSPQALRHAQESLDPGSPCPATGEKKRDPGVEPGVTA